MWTLTLLLASGPLLSFAGSVLPQTQSNSVGTVAVLSGPTWCTKNRNGKSTADRPWEATDSPQVTKDCCAAVNHRAYYNQFEQKCMGYGGWWDNAVDRGAFVRCCDSRGGGSHG